MRLLLSSIVNDNVLILMAERWNERSDDWAVGMSLAYLYL